MARTDKPVEGDIATLPLGARMRRARQEKGISLTEMAERLGYTKGHLSAVENLIGRPSRELVESYERELGIQGELLRVQYGLEPALGRRHSPISEDIWERLGQKMERSEGEDLKVKLDEVKKLLDDIWRAPHTTSDDLALLARFLEAGLREIKTSGGK